MRANHYEITLGERYMTRRGIRHELYHIKEWEENPLLNQIFPLLVIEEYNAINYAIQEDSQVRPF